MCVSVCVCDAVHLTVDAEGDNLRIQNKKENTIMIKITRAKKKKKTNLGIRPTVGWAVKNKISNGPTKLFSSRKATLQIPKFDLHNRLQPQAKGKTKCLHTGS